MAKSRDGRDGAVKTPFENVQLDPQQQLYVEMHAAAMQFRLAYSPNGLYMA